MTSHGDRPAEVPGEGFAAYQGAIADILRTLGTAPFDLDTTLDAIVAHAADLSGSQRGFIYLLDDDRYRHVADVGAPPEVVAFNLAHPITPTRATVTGRTAIERRPVHIPDVLEDPEYDYPEAQRLGAFRSMLGVPMLRDGVVVGVISVWRTELDPYREAQIALVESFADQAVIAVETARLVRTVERQRMELARFLSPQVAALVSSEDGERLLAGHRREITVVFCDLRGFTAFSETAEPEEVLGVLRAYHAAMGARITEAEGTLERFTGDGLMVFFNDPVEQRDHAERAVRMAIAMRSDVAGLARDWRRLGHRLGFGVGIATGYATLGRIGFEGRVDYAAVGSVVNLASRLSSEASDGSILMNPRAWAAVEDLVTGTSIGEIAMKGFSQPIDVFSVEALRDGSPAAAATD